MNAPIGTTPTFSLTFDESAINFLDAHNVYVSMVSPDYEIVKRNGDEGVVVEAHQIDIFLTQEETLAFGTGATAIQVNWTYVDGTRAASNIVRYRFGQNLLDKVVE
jgi:hypothetical protein